MKRPIVSVVLAVLTFSSQTLAQQKKPAEPKNISDSINSVWKVIAKNFVDLADAMPEDKWDFRPTQGEFKEARSFGEQVKHVACANEAWANKVS